MSVASAWAQRHLLSEGKGSHAQGFPACPAHVLACANKTCLHRLTHPLSLLLKATSRMVLSSLKL